SRSRPRPSTSPSRWRWRPRSSTGSRARVATATSPPLSATRRRWAWTSRSWRHPIEVALCGDLPRERQGGGRALWHPGPGQRAPERGVGLLRKVRPVPSPRGAWRAGQSDRELVEVSMKHEKDLAPRVVAMLDWAGLLEKMAWSLVDEASPDEGRLIDLRIVLES